MRPANRRRKIVYISEQYVLSLLSGGLLRNECLRLPQPLGLPKTARVLGVHTDFTRGSFALVIEDPSFKEAPEGAELPELKLTWETVRVPLEWIPSNSLCWSKLYRGTEHGPRHWPKVGWLVCHPECHTGRTTRVWLYAFSFAWFFEWNRQATDERKPEI